MKYVGIHAGHDAGISIHNDDGILIYYCAVERVTRIKHVYGLVHKNFNGFQQIKDIIKEDDFIIFTDNIYELNSSFIRQFELSKEIISISFKEYFPNLKDIIMVSHHIAHTFAAFLFSESDIRNEELLFISLDGGGHCANTKATNSIIGTISDKNVSIFEMDFAYSTHCLNTLLGGWSAGKLMGMSGYFTNSIPNDLNLNLYPEVKEKKSIYTNDEYLHLAGYYKYIINKIKNQIEIAIKKYSTTIKGLCISGGTHLALELNTWLYKTFTTKIAFCPATDDSGICLGLSCFGFWKTYNKMPKHINSPFIQTYEEDENYSNISLSDITNNLNNDTIYGIIRGNPECGPRALGHRSIIASPKKTQMYDMVSKKLKGREFYRPIAPIVTDRQFEDLFIGPKGKYMQYLVECKQVTKTICPAIVHIDNTARPQVVYEKDDPWLYSLLIEYGKISGVECLINTSLNKNAPICNTYKDAINDFGNNKDINIINIKD